MREMTDDDGRAVEKRAVYMVVANWAGSVFVKTLEYFQSQGGLDQEWGEGWKPVVASSLEDARRKGCSMFPEARRYSEQAKP